MGAIRNWFRRLRAGPEEQPAEEAELDMGVEDDAETELETATEVDAITARIDRKLQHQRSARRRRGATGGYAVNIGAPEVHGTETPMEAELVEDPERTRSQAGRQKGAPAPSPRGRSDRRLPPELKATYQDARITKMELSLQKLSKKLDRAAEDKGELRAEIDEIKSAVKRMEIGVLELDEMREGYARVERTVRELSALYDLISAQINPFIDLDEHQLGVYHTPSAETESSTTPTGPATAVDEGEGEHEHERESGGDLEALSRAVNPFIEGTTAPSAAESTAKPAQEPPHAPQRGPRRPGEIIYEWTSFLLERLTPNGAAQLLDSYIDLGLLDQEQRARVIDLINSGVIPITHEGDSATAQAEDFVIDASGEVEVLQDSAADAAKTRKLTAEEQQQSMRYLSELATANATATGSR